MPVFTIKNGGDTLTGSSGNDTILGGDGNDSVKSGDGDDYIYSADGRDTFEGGAGNDTLNKYLSQGSSYLDGGSGDDTIWGSDGNDTLLGGDGNDTWLEGYLGNDSISGGSGNDRLYGDEGNDTLDGGTADDYISGNEGNDIVLGGDGNDSLLGGDGNDYIDAGAGDDNINYQGEGGNDTVLAGAGNDYVNFTSETGNKLIDGGAGSDTIFGGNGNDTLDGGTGADYLYGSTGNDTYYIDNLFDRIYDHGGNDTANVSVSFVKIPSTIEKVNYINGAQALPYWINALLPDDAAGLFYKSILDNATIINYAFPSTLPSYDTASSHATGFIGFTATQIARTKEALAYISSVVNLQFAQTANPAQINTISFANNTQTDSSGYAMYPDSDNLSASDVFLNKATDTTFTLRNGEYQALTLIHEIGHALGLEHPFNKQDSTGTVSDPPYLSGAEDSTVWTVMSYTDSPAQYYLQYSPLDIAALQYLYGPSKTARAGNDTYKVTSASPNFIWDGAGFDGVDASNVTQSATIYMTPGYQGFLGTTKADKITTAGQITVNFGTVIENLVGSAYADHLYGNEVGNSIEGGAGNDFIEGWDGNDTLLGGTGNDTINGGTGIDTAKLSGSFGNSSLANYSFQKNSDGTWKVSYNGPVIAIYPPPATDGVDSLVNVERLQFTDKSFALDLEGNAGITAKVIGAVLGKAAVQNPAYVGIGLSYLDKGMSYADLGALALNAVGAVSNDAIVSTLWFNVVGFTASPSDKAPFVKMLSDGMKPGDLVVLAADTIFNTSNINLVGLAQTGIEYSPT